MTKISQYSTDVNITGNDKWIGSDAQNFLITKNFTPNNLANYFNGNNVIDIGASIRYTYQTLNPGELREQGTISFETEIGPQVNFSDITTFLLAKNTLKGNNVTDYLNLLVDGKVLISKSSNINIFGYYKITSVEPWIPDTNFFVVTVDFLQGNGFIYEDLDYLISLVDKVQDVPPPVWGNITGTITAQTDLISYLGSNYYPLSSNPAGYITLSSVTLQNAYDNSTTGTITLDATRGNIKIKSILGLTKSMSFFTPTTNTEALYFSSEESGGGIKRIVANGGNFFVDSGSNIQGNNLTINDIYSSGDVYTNNNKSLISYLSPLVNHYFKGISGTKWESNVKIEYAADYSALFSSRSLIDKGYADANYYPLSSNPAGYLTSAVTSVSATSPITSSGGNTPTISTSMATNKLIGRSTAGTGVMEEITIGTGLTLSGGTLNASATGGISHTTASGTDTYTATVTGVTAYNDGDAYLVRFTNGNTTSATLNINTLGAKSLYRNNDGALIGGDIWAGAEMLCVFNSTLNGFQCIGTSPNALFSYVTNADSVSITKGMPVYAFGGQGDRMTVKRANNSSDATSAQTVGIVASTSIAAGQKGIIIMQGLLDGLNILPTSTYSDGDAIYLGATAGSITKVKPYAPNHLVYLGVVTTASNGSAGRLYVRVQNGYELQELHNVDALNPNNNDGIFYNSTTQLWEHKNVLAVAAERRNANNSTNSNINYCGIAPADSLESSSVWTITRLTITLAGAVTTASAINVKWTDRETATYT